MTLLIAVFKRLGVILDVGLTWIDHIDGNLCHYKDKTVNTEEATPTAYYALLESVLCYTECLTSPYGY